VLFAFIFAVESHRLVLQERMHNKFINEYCTSELIGRPNWGFRWITFSKFFEKEIKAVMLHTEALHFFCFLTACGSGKVKKSLGILSFWIITWPDIQWSAK
jgi:hypothetical protein